MDRYELQDRAKKNNGIVIISEKELEECKQIYGQSQRHSNAIILDEQVYSDSGNGHWGGVNKIVTYTEKDKNGFWKCWAECFNNDGYANEQDEFRMDDDKDYFNENVKGISIKETSLQEWSKLYVKIKRFAMYSFENALGGDTGDLIRLAMLMENSEEGESDEEL